MWSDFPAFKVAAGQLTSHFACFYGVFTCQFPVKVKHIKLYISAIRAFHMIYGLSTHCFRDERLSLFLKSIQNSAPLTPKSSSLIDIEMLYAIIQHCDKMEKPLVFRPLYLTCFFSFLRLSNILPHTIHSFDFIRQLARGDFITQAHGGLLLIKWSKTILNHRDTVTLPLPFLGSSSLCPITALTTMIHAFPAEPNDPLFLPPRVCGLVPLTDSVARKHLKVLSLALEIAPPLTFHGASWAFHNGVPVEFIKNHGTWKSDAIHTYLVSPPPCHLQFPGPSLLPFLPSYTTSYLELGCFSISKINHLPATLLIWLTHMWHGFTPLSIK